MINTNKVEKYSLGNGIWIAQKNINENEYALINSEAPEFLAVFLVSEDEDDCFLPENMKFSSHESELNAEFQEIHKELLSALQ